MTIAPRFLVTLVVEGKLPLGSEVWQDTTVIMPDIACANWTNTLSGEIIPGGNQLAVGQILKHFPVALLMSVSPDVSR